MQRIQPQEVTRDVSASVWAVKDFCERNQLSSDNEVRLLQLFGPFATAAELRYNVEHRPKWR
ncbi:hypothetical protein FHT86_001374 [Rhizobium sp. BK313]|nr:hypothetical protein [Rhizobium sp. BK313]